MLALLSGQDSPKQDAIPASFKAIRAAEKQETAAPDAWPQNVAAAIPDTNSSKAIRQNLSLDAGMNEREAGAPAQQSTKDMEAELMRLQAKVVDQRRIKKLERKAAKLRAEIAAQRRNHAAAASNFTTLHPTAAIDATFNRGDLGSR